LLKRADYGVLSMVTEDGRPYGVPLNFCVIDHCIYLHCALEGQKTDNFEKNRFVVVLCCGRYADIAS